MAYALQHKTATQFAGLQATGATGKKISEQLGCQQRCNRGKINGALTLKLDMNFLNNLKRSGAMCPEGAICGPEKRSPNWIIEE